MNLYDVNHTKLYSYKKNAIVMPHSLNSYEVASMYYRIIKASVCNNVDSTSILIVFTKLSWLPEYFL